MLITPRITPDEASLARRVDHYSRRQSWDPIEHERLYREITRVRGIAAAEFFDEYLQLPYYKTQIYPYRFVTALELRRLRQIHWVQIAIMTAGWVGLLAILLAGWVGGLAHTPLPVVAVLTMLAAIGAFWVVGRLERYPADNDTRRELQRRYEQITEELQASTTDAAVDAKTQRTIQRRQRRERTTAPESRP